MSWDNLKSLIEYRIVLWSKTGNHIYVQTVYY
jgi:hypothetical protein